MSDSTISNIIVIGNSGSGKTEFIERIIHRLQEKGRTVGFMVDRTGLEGFDLYDAYENEGGFHAKRTWWPKKVTPIWGEGVHTSFTANHQRSPKHIDNFRTTLLDGTSLNEITQSIIRAMAARKDSDNFTLVAEIATGLSVDGRFFRNKSQGLYQDAQRLGDLIVESGLQGKCLIIEMHTPMDVRLKRNNERGNHALHEDEFKKLFPDGDLMPEEYVRGFGGDYFYFDNSAPDKALFKMHADLVFEYVILPRLEIDVEVHREIGHRTKES